MGFKSLLLKSVVPHCSPVGTQPEQKRAEKDEADSCLLFDVCAEYAGILHYVFHPSTSGYTFKSFVHRFSYCIEYRGIRRKVFWSFREILQLLKT